MSGEYVIPTQARFGHVHLKVASIERSLEFYRDLLGFELTTMYGTQAAFISAGGYHHHLGTNTWAAGAAKKLFTGKMRGGAAKCLEMHYAR